jgi:transposase-like protein
MSGSSTLNAASAPAGLDVLATNMANHAVLERGLQTELTGHLGYAKGDPEDQLLPNSRNGFSETTACNEIGD